MNIHFERGDSIKFGKEWCAKNDSPHLIDKVVLMTPQYFEVDNGLYCHEVECPGMVVIEGDEPDSIYNLFGNNFEHFMDCVLIKGTDEDKAFYQKIIDDQIKAEEEAWNRFEASLNLNSTFLEN